MKRINFLMFTAIIVVLLAGCSTKQQLNKTPEEEARTNSNDKAKFEYETGYKEGYKKAQEIEKDKQFKRAEEIITKEFLSWIKQLQIGSYLVKEHFITPPIPITIENEDGSIETRLEGCKIQKPYTVEDIFKIFDKAKSQKYTALVHNSEVATETTSTNKSISIVERDIPVNMPSKLNGVTKTITLNIPKTLTNKSILDAYNADYSTQEKVFIAMFNNNEEASAFCSETSICKYGVSNAK